MTKFMLRERTIRDEQIRVCVVNAGDREEAKHNAEMKYGGVWDVMEPHSTLDGLSNMVEDSPSEAVLLNI